MKALIIGGGISGPVTAAALRRAGIESVVYEAHEGPAESIGLFLGLAVNGMRVLRQLDLLEPVMRADTISTPWMEFSSTTGKHLGTVSNGWLDAETPSITLMRGALQRALAEAVQTQGVELRYGKRYVGYEDTGSGVVARFDDGSEAEGDMLVGADGIHSRVRATMDRAAPAPSYTGLLNLGGVVRETGLEPTAETMHMIWGRRAFFGYTVRPGGEAWWFANCGEEREPERGELAAVPTAEWKRRLRGQFAEDPSFIVDLIDATDEIGATPIHDMPSIPTWSWRRVALVGDAAHAVSPSAGQGASLALEDAMVMARCLRDVADPQLAFPRYEALRRERVEKIVAVGRRRGEYKAPRNRAARFVRDLFMPLVFRFLATEESMSWIYDHRIPWEEPDAGEVEAGVSSG